MRCSARGNKGKEIYLGSLAGKLALPKLYGLGVTSANETLGPDLLARPCEGTHALGVSWGTLAAS